jgi:hypothetical protein
MVLPRSQQVPWFTWRDVGIKIKCYRFPDITGNEDATARDALIWLHYEYVVGIRDKIAGMNCLKLAQLMVPGCSSHITSWSLETVKLWNTAYPMELN